MQCIYMQAKKMQCECNQIDRSIDKIEQKKLAQILFANKLAHFICVNFFFDFELSNF